jgi:hypothetical protein
MNIFNKLTPSSRATYGMGNSSNIGKLCRDPFGTPTLGSTKIRGNQGGFAGGEDHRLPSNKLEFLLQI